MSAAARSTARSTVTALAALVALALLLPAAGVHASKAPDLPDQAAQQARQAARADRHAEAIDAFRRAVEAAPQRRREWLLEWADQHTWSGRLDEALALYREALATLDADGRQRARIGLARAQSWAGRHDEALATYDAALAVDAKDREAQLGRARVLSWTNRQAQALEQYRAALRDHPGDDEARRGIGRVQSWRGRHREAAAAMQQFLQDRPRDREATLILAESLAWMGRADRARAVLREQVAADAGDSRAASLPSGLDAEQRPHTSVDVRDFDQSDGLRIQDLSLGTRLSQAEGRGHVGLRLGATRFTPPSGPVGRIDVLRPGAEARWRIGDALEWNGRVGLDLIDTRGAAGDHRRWVHDTYLTWWPADLLRLDLGSSRWTFDSEETLREGLTARQVKLSVDLLPDELTRGTLRLSRTLVSDGNHSNGWQFEAERRVVQDPRVHLGVRHTRYGFGVPGQGGYFNPRDYRSDEATVQASGGLPGGWRWQLRWAAGREEADPGGSRPIRSGSASLSWQANRELELEAAYDHSTSRTLSSGGFERGIARLTVRYRH